MADPLYLLKLIDTVFDNLQGIFTESFHYSCGHNRPYTLYTAGAQILSDAIDRSRDLGTVAEDLELPPKFRVVEPDALHMPFF